MLYLMTFLMLFDPGLRRAHARHLEPIPEEIEVEITLPANTPSQMDLHSAKVLLDLHIHYYKWKTPGARNGIFLLPSSCFKHIKSRDLWRVFTYWKPRTYFVIKRKIAKRIWGLSTRP